MSHRKSEQTQVCRAAKVALPAIPARWFLLQDPRNLIISSHLTYCSFPTCLPLRQSMCNQKYQRLTRTPQASVIKLNIFHSPQHEGK